MLARSVDVGKWLFVQKAGQTVFLADGAHRFHNQLVVVAGDVGGRIFRRKLVLGRSCLVVFCLAGYAHLPQVFIQILHKFADTDADAAAVVVVQFLAFGGFGSKQGASTNFQIQSLVIELVVHQEVFLLCTDHRGDAGDGVVAQCAQQAYALLGYCLHRAQQRSFGVQRLAVIGAKGSWNE